MPQRAAGLLLWARRAGDIDRLGGGAAANASSAMPHQTRQDCRDCLSTAAAATQTRQAATPSHPTAATLYTRKM